MSDDRVLVLDGLGKDFGATVALEGLTCEVHRGEIVGLLGAKETHIITEIGRRYAESGA